MSEDRFQPVRGTHDLIGDVCLKHQYIKSVASAIASLYGYDPIETPIFERTSVFKRTLGETSDVVGKEMYTFDDRGGDSLTLRPEGTAGVARAVISNGLTQSLPLKLIYEGPMMRYERPQKGRTRQFHQLGVECLGIAEPLVDVETIALAIQILDRLDVLSRITLEINTLGDLESRQAYRTALVDYFSKHQNKLSEDSRLRLERNPLRILDSKDPQDQELNAKAPHFEQFLNESSKDFFRKVCEGLKGLEIEYKHNPHLVRGLDYYCHTAFEITTPDLGAQATVLAGGRYDGLMAQLGGPETPGIGWAMGIDRIALMLDKPMARLRPMAVIAVDEETAQPAFQLAMGLRSEGIKVEFAYVSSVGKQMKRANKVNACAAVLIGPDELKSSQATVRNLDTGEQNLVAFENLTAYLRDNFNPF